MANPEGASPLRGLFASAEISILDFNFSANARSVFKLGRFTGAIDVDGILDKYRDELMMPLE